MKAALLAVIMLAVAGIAFRLAATRNLGQAAAQPSATSSIATPPPVSARTLALPLYFEPNQGQTDFQVKYLARGLGYGLFLTANETVLELQHPARIETGLAASAATPHSASSVIRMHLEGASAAARLQASQPLPGKSSYFIGNDPSKWVRNIPQFGRVEYQGVYPGIDLVYYGNDHQLEYDFRIAPGADANQIALNFQGASARIDAGDLVLTTNGGDVRFHAPHIYQSSANQQTDIAGGFRLLAANKIGFTVGPYDHSRELVIDPVLNYSTYLGGANGAESLVQVAVDTANDIYLAGSTNSADFPVTSNAIQPCLGEPGVLAGSCTASTAQNIFIAVINTADTPQLTYATYLGGSGMDSLSGIAVSSSIDSGTTGYDVYVAGSTTSPNFPTSTIVAPFQTAPLTPGTHGFVSRLNLGTSALRYSTYLSGSTTGGTDMVTGLAVDASQDAYVAGTTTSTNGPSNGFPSNSFAYQPCPFEPAAQSSQTGCTITSGPTQFFASKIYTGSAGASGPASMLYSTYLGGGNPANATSTGGGVAVDTTGNMYFTGTTTMQNYTGPGLGAAYPILNAYQACLNQPGSSQGTTCTPTNPTDSDAILVKLNPSQSEPGADPFFSTYLGGSSSDAGIAVAIDGADDAYVTGSTGSGDWSCPGCLAPTPFTYTDTTATNAFIAEISNQTATNTIFPLTYFAWLGGTKPDGDQTTGQAIAVDSAGYVHVAGQTFSPNLPTTSFVTLQGYPNFIEQFCDAEVSNSGTCNGDAFVALVNPSLTVTEGDYVTYLGGSGLDNGTGIAVDSSNNTYVAGTTISPPSTPLCTPPNCLPPFNGFPITANAFQSTLGGSKVANAFVTVLGSSSNVVVTAASGSPTPIPANAGVGTTFSFNVTNNGPNPATSITFNAYFIPTTGYSDPPTASVFTGSGSCDNNLVAGQTYIPCTIPSLNAGATAEVQVVVTPPTQPTPASVAVSCTFSVNNGGTASCPSAADQTDNVADFTFPPPNPSTLTVVNGGLASFPITVAPLNNLGYNGTITLTQSSDRPIVAASPTPQFLPSATVTLNGTGSQSVTLNIQTVARPVNTGSLFRRTAFYAAWLPIGGLSLAGLGIGAARKRRRWIVGALLGLLAGLILLQPACSSNSSNVTSNQGTSAGTYHITVTGSASTNASHQTHLTLIVQ